MREDRRRESQSNLPTMYAPEIPGQNTPRPATSGARNIWQTRHAPTPAKRRRRGKGDVCPLARRAWRRCQERRQYLQKPRPRFNSRLHPRGSRRALLCRKLGFEAQLGRALFEHLAGNGGWPERRRIGPGYLAKIWTGGRRVLSAIARKRAGYLAQFGGRSGYLAKSSTPTMDASPRGMRGAGSGMRRYWRPNRSAPGEWPTRGARVGACKKCVGRVLKGVVASNRQSKRVVKRVVVETELVKRVVRKSCRRTGKVKKSCFRVKQVVNRVVGETRTTKRVVNRVVVDDNRQHRVVTRVVGEQQIETGVLWRGPVSEIVLEEG